MLISKYTLSSHYYHAAGSLSQIYPTKENFDCAKFDMILVPRCHKPKESTCNSPSGRALKWPVEAALGRARGNCGTATLPTRIARAASSLSSWSRYIHSDASQWDNSTITRRTYACLDNCALSNRKSRAEDCQSVTLASKQSE